MKEICTVDIFDMFHLLRCFSELVGKKVKGCMARNGEKW